MSTLRARPVRIGTYIMALLALAVCCAHVSARNDTSAPQAQLSRDNGRNILHTPYLHCMFAPKEQGFGLVSMTHPTRGTEFLTRADQKTPPRLWRIELTPDRANQDSFVQVFNYDACRAGSIALEDNTLVITWQGVDVGDEQAAIDVTVTVGLDDMYDTTAWRIAIDNHSDRYGIWQVHFPILDLGVIGESGENDYLLMPPAEGRAVQSPIDWDQRIKNERTLYDLTTDATPHKMKDDKVATGFGFGAQEPYGCPYPSGRAQIQLCAYYEKDGNYYYPGINKGSGLYLAAHDAEPLPKVFFATNEPDNQRVVFKVGGFPEDSAKPGLDYHPRWPMMIAAYEGDWYDAAAKYRSWATRQKWAMLGPLHSRGDIPDWLTKITAWVRMDTSRGKYPLEFNDEGLAFYREHLPGVLGLQWYRWEEGMSRWNISAGVFPPKPFAMEGIAEAIEKYQNDDCVVFPYVNTRLWVSARGSTMPVHVTADMVQPHVQRKASGQLSQVEGRREDGGTWSHVCIHSAFYHDYLAKISRQIIHNYHPKGLYLDQAGGLGYSGGFYDRQDCHDPDHGHPLGVTGTSVKAEHDRIATLLHATHTVDGQVMLTGEGTAETFIDVINNKLIHYEVWPGYVPIFGAVYHDYITYYGRTIRLKSGSGTDPMPAMQIGWQLVMGNQLGRLWPKRHDTSDPEIVKYLPYLVQACEVLHHNHKYLTLGQMLRPPYISDVPDITTAEFSRTNNLCTLPSVAASSWRAPDDTVGIVITNMSEKAQKCTITFDPEEYGLTDASTLMQTYPENAHAGAVVNDAGLIEWQRTIDGLSVIMLNSTASPE